MILKHAHQVAHIQLGMRISKYLIVTLGPALTASWHTIMPLSGFMGRRSPLLHAALRFLYIAEALSCDYSLVLAILRVLLRIPRTLEAWM